MNAFRETLLLVQKERTIRAYLRPILNGRPHLFYATCLLIAVISIGLLTFGIFRTSIRTSLGAFLHIPAAQQQSSAEAYLSYTKDAAERAASLLNVLAGAAAVVGATCPAMCGRSAQVLSGVAWLASGLVADSALGMDDRDFRHIAVPSTPEINLSAFPASLQGIFGSLADAIGLANVIIVTANRAALAARAGSTDWVEKQHAASVLYEAQLQSALHRLNTELAAYAASEHTLLVDGVVRAISSYEAQADKVSGAIKSGIVTWREYFTK